MSFIEELAEKIKGKNLKIVYPEAEDLRIMGAAIRHQKDGIIQPILLGNPDKLAKIAKEEGWDLSGITIMDPENNPDQEKFVDCFVERRKGKATPEKARELLKNPNYFGVVLVQLGLADGMVSGAVGTTGDTIRPALQIIKTRPSSKIVSGVMVMVGPENQRYIFADIAVNISPSEEEIAAIAGDSAWTAKQFGIDPTVALLSFSTFGSANCPEQEKMARATALAKSAYPDLFIDGEMQFDAAIDPEVGERKAPNSLVAGKAKVFVFPDLQAGNIGYKIAQRLGGYVALGPILQGIAKPVNDLSRGCSEEDAYQLAIVTAFQALES